MVPFVWRKMGVSWNLPEQLCSLLDEYTRENSRAVDDEIQQTTMSIPFPSRNLSGILGQGPHLGRGCKEEEDAVLREWNARNEYLGQYPGW